MIVGGNQAWTPIMDSAGLGAGLTESPCKACPHRHMDKNVCAEFPDCLRKTVREPVFCATPAHSLPYRDDDLADNVCQFPGCGKTIKKGRYCQRHSALVCNRRRRRPFDPESWHAPVDLRRQTRRRTEEVTP